MKTESASESAPQTPLLGSYVAEFERWMRNSPRCRNSPETEDICQSIRLALWEQRDVPATREEARRIFLRLASRFESRARRQIFAQGALVEQPEELAAVKESDFAHILALFDALEKLDDQQRWLVKECKIEGRTLVDVAKQLGVTEETVRNRLWRAMTKLLAILKDEEKRTGKTEKAGALVAPLMFEFTDVQRAAFSAIWQAEGRVPTFGGGPPGPTTPPPVAPGVFPAVSAVVASAGSVATTVAIAVAVILLMLFPASIVAIHYFWNPPSLQTAQKGLNRLLPSDIEDVDQVVPLYPPQPAAAPGPDDVQAPVPSSVGSVERVKALRSSQFSGSSNTPSSSPPIDHEEVERARRRRTPRFLPSR